MKKYVILFLISLLVFTGCLFSPNEDLLPGDVFFLTDFDGNPTTTFRTGEDFHMYFNLVNTTQDSLDYSFTGPPVYFTIFRGAARIVGSTDGLSFAQVVIYDKLAPGDTIKGLWLAPTPAHWSSKKTLQPGEYRAVASFPTIEELQTDTITAINFTITE